MKCPAKRSIRRMRRRGTFGVSTWSFSRYFRKKFVQKYPFRFVQGMDYKEIKHPLYKYEMTVVRRVQTSWLGTNIETEYFSLNELGLLTIRPGYRWDGPSGPTVDTPSFMRSSAAHDCFFQIMRLGLICDSKRQRFFEVANKDLKTISIEDGMLKTRASYVKTTVELFGEKHTIKGAA